MSSSASAKGSADRRGWSVQFFGRQINAHAPRSDDSDKPPVPESARVQMLEHASGWINGSGLRRKTEHRVPRRQTPAHPTSQLLSDSSIQQRSQDCNLSHPRVSDTMMNRAEASFQIMCGWWSDGAWWSWEGERSRGGGGRHTQSAWRD